MPTSPERGDTQAADTRADGTRKWVKPVVVEYGHLAKLTRGPSGAVTEQGTYKKKCL